MKTKIILIAVLVIVLSGSAVWLRAQAGASATDRKILYYTCPMHPSVKSDKPGNCPICGMSLEAVYASTNAPSNSTNSPAMADAKPKPYPFNTCIVDGMKLDSMGGPYVFVYQGQ